MTVKTTRMPAAFLGHGSPMNTLESNRYTQAWRAFGAAVPATPRAILVVSAHLFVGTTAVTAMRDDRAAANRNDEPRMVTAVARAGVWGTGKGPTVDRSA